MSDDRSGLLAWLRRTFADPRPVMIMPYRGFGTPEEVTMLARVLRDPGIPPASADDSAWENLLASYERFESDEIGGVLVRATLGGSAAEARSDDEGYLELTFRPARPLALGWHRVHLEAPGSDAAVVDGSVLVAEPGGVGVISDIDDTVIESAVTNPLRLAQIMLLGNAQTRAIFEGVPALYRALQSGVGGDAPRPIFYLSGSPWNLYDLLVEIFEHNKVPAGPLLLRSLEREVVMPALRGVSSLRGHKLDQIARLLATYPEKQFVLLGDSGQKDPEIYQQVVADQPGRVRAVYIRDVTGAGRDGRVEAIGAEISARGVAFVYSADTRAFADDAARQGLILRDDELGDLAGEEGRDAAG
jgi:phosphatidate phosphatase APP1